jgi:hypothetical protein
MKRVFFLLTVAWMFASCALFEPLRVSKKIDEGRPVKVHSQENAVNLHLGLPWVNAFNADYGTQDRRSNIGFTGISVGVDYFYADNSFVELSAAGIMDYAVPITVHIDYEGGTTQHMGSLYGSVSNNHLFARKRFSVGYGLSFGRDIWDTINRGRWDDDAPKEDVMRESVFRISNSLGLVVPLRYYIKRSFYIGLVYRPMIVQFADRARFRYQHTASFEIGWRIRLAK